MRWESAGRAAGSGGTAAVRTWASVLGGRVVLLVDDSPLVRRVGSMVEDRFHLARLASWGELEDLFAQLPANALILTDPASAPAEALQGFLARYPSATVVAVVPGGPRSAEEIRRLAEWGVAQVISLDFDASPYVLRQRLESARLRTFRFSLAQVLPGGVPSVARVILDRALEVASSDGGVQDLAHVLSVSHRTLVRRCRRTGVPPPRDLLRWMRLLLASAMLDDPGRTVLDVALSCGYSSDTSLRRALRKTDLPSPMVLRQGDAFRSVAEGLIADLATERGC